jgi:hypothetical protein
MTDLSTYQLLYGRDEAPAAPRLLRAGPVTALLDGCDLRYVRVGGVEVLRRLYVAVRDHNWNTILGEVSNFTCDATEDSFRIGFDMRHTLNDISFSWHGEIAGGPDGKITYSMDGTCGSEYRYNRIGFCVLHAPTVTRGARYRGETPHGPISGVIEPLIEPQRIVDGVIQAMFPAVSRLEIDHATEDGSQRATAHFDFTGDLFEMEDQRNWTDGSFKTYCTPLAEPWPKDAKAAQKIVQTVALSVSDVSDQSDVSDGEGGPVRLTLGEPTGRKLPAIGLGAASHGEPLSSRELSQMFQLCPLNIDHVRVDLHLQSPVYYLDLKRVEWDSAMLNCGMELAVFITNDAPKQLAELAEHLQDVDPPVVRVLVYHESEPTTAGQWVRMAREILGPVIGGAPIGGGTNANFCELNRGRPEIGDMDIVTFSINPQVHAFDETSIVETLDAQADTVLSAQAFSGGKPIVVSPVTLKPRFNPNATGADTPLPPGALPRPVDPRQMSLFAAAWTLGSIKYLAESGVDSVTFYETTSWRGVMETEQGSPLPDKFPSLAGTVFPMYHVFAEVASAKGAEIIACDTSDPLAVLGLGVKTDNGLRVIIANMTVEPQRVMFGPVNTGTARLRRLNAETAKEALSDPGAFRTMTEELMVGEAAIRLQLEPYETVSITL